MLARLAAWGEGEPAIRALILTSSRARPGAPVDVFSDYDVIVAVTDAVAFHSDDTWLSAFGQPLVRWGDEGELYGTTTYFRGVVYDDEVKVDYSIWPVTLLDRVTDAETLPDSLDVGYRVLLDEDHRTSRWRPPSYAAHVPPRPTQAAYRELVEEFWWDCTYVAKGLWRGDVVLAKFVLDCDIKHNALRRLLEWRIEVDHGWSLKPGAYGRGLEHLLPADLWTRLASTWVGPGIEENWNALSAAVTLFSQVANQVGAALGYRYPAELEERMTAYLAGVRALPKDTPQDTDRPDAK